MLFSLRRTLHLSAVKVGFLPPRGPRARRARKSRFNSATACFGAVLAKRYTIIIINNNNNNI